MAPPAQGETPDPAHQQRPARAPGGGGGNTAKRGDLGSAQAALLARRSPGGRPTQDHPSLAIRFAAGPGLDPAGHVWTPHTPFPIPSPVPSNAQGGAGTDPGSSGAAGLCRTTLSLPSAAMPRSLLPRGSTRGLEKLPRCVLQCAIPKGIMSPHAGTRRSHQERRAQGWEHLELGARRCWGQPGRTEGTAAGLSHRGGTTAPPHQLPEGPAGPAPWAGVAFAL